MRLPQKLVATTAIAALTCVTRIQAQDAPVPPVPPARSAPTPPAANNPDVQKQAQEQLDRAHEQLDRQLEKVELAIESLSGEATPALREQLKMAKAQADLQVRQAEREFELAQAPATPPPLGEITLMPEAARRRYGLYAHGPTKVLVIRSSQIDSKAQANLEEDLSVMSRVFERSIGQKLGEDDGLKASGIKVLFAPDSGAARNLYLEGYGALFLMNVRFPLLAPATKADSEKPKKEVDSSWEDAKRDLYGEADPWNIARNFAFEFHGGEPQEYDANKVEKLKQSLIEAMKSAGNIRGLKPDDWITVTVLGGISHGPVRVKSVRRSSGDRSSNNFSNKQPDASPEALVVEARDEQSGGPRSTALTMRVRKSDVDEFAKGRLDLEQFSKKVSSITYATGLGGGSGGADSVRFLESQ